MCCILEIAMFVFGIVTLTKGKFTLSAQKVVTGPPAYVIGAILTATLPLIVAVAFTIGFVIGMQNPEAAARGEVGNNIMFSLIDVIGVLGSGLIVIVIAAIYGRNPAEATPAANPYSVPGQPQNPGNPYNPPFNR